ncbi:hypothetical protein ACHAWF_000325, partial [Thalassiosira exigua]
MATTNRNNLTDDEAKYLRAKLSETYEEPFGYFYLTYKLHKTPVKTRPVCSDCASIPHTLGQWVDEQLQPIVQAQHTYFKNSFALKEELLTLTLPPNASLFSFDAVSMYTNIDTEECIARLENYFMDPITQSTFPHYSAEALVEAIKIIMRNNRMKDKLTDTIHWNAFKADVNNGGLTWEFTPRSKQVNFMDLTIQIVDGHIETKLYKKPLALHLYI